MLERVILFKPWLFSSMACICYITFYSFDEEHFKHNTNPRNPNCLCYICLQFTAGAIFYASILYYVAKNSSNYSSCSLDGTVHQPNPRLGVPTSNSVLSKNLFLRKRYCHASR